MLTKWHPLLHDFMRFAQHAIALSVCRMGCLYPYFPRKLLYAEREQPRSRPLSLLQRTIEEDAVVIECPSCGSINFNLTLVKAGTRNPAVEAWPY